jgi:hypothetical protein
MKGLKGLKEIHEIMEKIYEEEKDLSPEQKVKKLKEESDKFIAERKLSLKRVKPTGLRHPLRSG